MAELQEEVESLPSFSMIIETDNLADADLDGLAASLASIDQQTWPPTKANECLLIDSGEAPPELLQQLSDRYPWIKVHRTSLSGYYETKMLGAELATGEILVYCDSDCVYEPDWLQVILSSFTQDEAIAIVAGETITRGRGAYGLAMAFTYIFPQYSGRKEMFPTRQYFLNNVAFRRELLLSIPIPVDLPLYRGNCVIHADSLGCYGHLIWQQPLARATHAPPHGGSHFFWRFLLIGHDYYWQNRLLSNKSQPKTNRSNPDSMAGIRNKLRIFKQRAGKIFGDRPGRWLYFPLAVPIMIASALLILLGYQITAAKPYYLMKVHSD
jgi:glycosyltransferase involved in cell wall biosynthesis